MTAKAGRTDVYRAGTFNTEIGEKEKKESYGLRTHFRELQAEPAVFG